MACALGRIDRAVELLARAEILRDEIGTVLMPFYRDLHERSLSCIREGPGEHALSDARANGTALTLEEMSSRGLATCSELVAALDPPKRRKRQRHHEQSK